MSFIKNIEIWKNHRPRVCNFDISDYCNYGAMGNTCTDSTLIPDIEELYTTARATSDAWFKAVNEYFLASYAFYIDPGFNDGSVSPIVIPDNTLNTNCNSLRNLSALCSLYYDQPNGFIIKGIEFKSKRAQLINSLLPDGAFEKKTGVYTYTENIQVSPNSPAQPYTYTIDFTNYQTPDYNHYLEYRTSMGTMMQLFKRIMIATGNHSFTAFDIPAACPADIVIGTQTWTKCNLDVDKYRNGDSIPQVQDATEWANLTTGAWCYYENNTEYGKSFGKLYNWYAVNDPRGLAPVGYHIPTNAEWEVLQDYVDDDGEPGNALKTPGESNRICVNTTNCKTWSTPNVTNVTNSSLFTALPGGKRALNGAFEDVGDLGHWWTATESTPTTARMYYLINSNAGLDIGDVPKTLGFSVRLIKN